MNLCMWSEKTAQAHNLLFAYERKRSAGGSSACADGFGLNQETATSFNRASKRSERAERRNCRQTGGAILVGALRKVGAGATLEEIGWTPISMRRWLRVKLRKRWKTGLVHRFVLEYEKEAAGGSFLE